MLLFKKEKCIFGNKAKNISSTNLKLYMVLLVTIMYVHAQFQVNLFLLINRRSLKPQILTPPSPTHNMTKVNYYWNKARSLCNKNVQCLIQDHSPHSIYYILYNILVIRWVFFNRWVNIQLLSVSSSQIQRDITILFFVSCF